MTQDLTLERLVDALKHSQECCENLEKAMSLLQEFREHLEKALRNIDETKLNTQD